MNGAHTLYGREFSRPPSAIIPHILPANNKNMFRIVKND